METTRPILIAEDDPDQLEMLSNALLDAGFNVAAVHRGDDVLPRIEELHPSLVIIDVHMPGLSGFEVLKRIRQSKDLKALPVVLVSAYYSSEKLEAMIMLGANSGFSKPFEMREMIQEAQRLTGLANADLDKSK